ncbi:MAG: hypothetical protein ACTXOO_01045 [Sodalis sp. (in: enterobacteria)]
MKVAQLHSAFYAAFDESAVTIGKIKKPVSILSLASQVRADNGHFPDSQRYSATIYADRALAYRQALSNQ